jgi:hypothetical protein
MTKAKCPLCGCEKFYVKDPDDEYETYTFECRDGEVCFDPEAAGCDPPAPDADTQTFCDRCAWHDRLAALKSNR